MITQLYRNRKSRGKELWERFTLLFLKRNHSRAGMVFFRSGISILVVKFASLVIAFLSVFVLARILGPEQYGVYSYAMALITLLAVPAKAGVPNLVTRELVFSLQDDRVDLARGLLYRSRQAVLLISVIICALAMVGVLLFIEDRTSASFKTIMLSLTLIPTIALGSLRGGLLRGLKRVAIAQLPEYVIRPGLLLAFVSIGLMTHISMTPQLVMGMHLLCGIIAFTVGTVLLRKTAPVLFEEGKISYQSRRWASALLPFTLLAGAEILIQQMPVIVLGIFSEVENVAFFRVASQVGMITLLGLTMINLLIAPYVAQSFRAGNVRELQQIITIAARVATGFALIVSVAFATFGGALLGYVLGADYRAAYVPALILCAGFIFRSIFAPVSIVMNMTGHENLTWRANAVTAVACLVLCFTMIPLLGITGTALAATGTMVFWTLILLFVAKRAITLRFGAF